VAVDEGSDVQALKERGDEGQRAEVEGIVGDGRAMPGWSHNASAGDKVAGETRRRAQRGERIVGAESSLRQGEKKVVPGDTPTRQERRIVGRLISPNLPWREAADHPHQGCGKWA
jgi:hypothetical protein